MMLFNKINNFILLNLTHNDPIIGLTWVLNNDILHAHFTFNFNIIIKRKIAIIIKICSGWITELFELRHFIVEH